MAELAKLRERLPGMLLALAVGIPAGYLFHLLHTPIPWMVGPMVAVATLNLFGVPMHSPPFARQMGQVILGSAVSLYFTPTVVAALAANLPAIFAAGLYQFVKARDELLATSDDALALLVSTVASGVVGYWSIAFLLRYLKTHTTYVFIVYRLVVGGLIFYWLWRGTLAA